MENQANQNLMRALIISRKLLEFANHADLERQDVGCGVLYGMMRDAAYKIRMLAEAEIEQHKLLGIWQEPPAAMVDADPFHVEVSDVGLHRQS